ncbi:CdaR family transcriptional regulator [Virgibacillus xinjiangensis]|uniref:CdaR family transcriptional regulator n=1 Tax=Virgibacillus xinjiangensis TaxID=393090 RepID=A0ABV7CX83_9BACI
MLTRKIARAIVRETSKRIHRNINIMDVDGRIIATRDNSRIDSLHEGALHVLDSGEPLLIHPGDSADWEGAQPGINLPILFKENIIGVIGITGDPAEMEDIGALVKMTTELMIKQEDIASQMEWKQRTTEMVIEQLLSKQPSYSDIERGLSRLDFQLTAPFMSILIEVSDWAVTNRTLIERLETAVGTDTCLAGFISVHRLFIGITDMDKVTAGTFITPIQETLHDLGIPFRLSYSLPFTNIEGFHQSYLDCDLALRLSSPEKEIIPFTQMEVKALIHQLDKKMASRFSRRVLPHLSESAARTLDMFFRHNLNLQKTADALYVHRNTLIYRIHKIAEETGHDPRNFEDALILQVALWIRERG